MASSAQEARSVCFGPFELDLHTGCLTRQGQQERLALQPSRLLVLLVRRRGELVSREEVRSQLWPGETFVDFDHGLNNAVNRLREALRDSAASPLYIQTMPRRGYRFIADVTASEAAQAAKTLRAVTSTPETAECRAEPAPAIIAPVELLPRPLPRPQDLSGTAPARRHWPARWWLAAAFATIVGAATPLFFYLRQSRFFAPERTDPNAISAASYADVRVTPLTALPGMEYAPTFSPDGSQVAFAWDGGRTEETSPYDLYVKVIGSERLEQLTHRPAWWIVPAWSPDGRNIAFARMGEGNSGIFLVSARGGPERRLADINLTYAQPLSISWSPDGQTLLYGSDGGMHSVHLDKGEVQSLEAPPGCDTAWTPASSPDGEWLAFSCGRDEVYDIDVRPAHGGVAREVAHNVAVHPLAWSTDSRRILYTGLSGELFEVGRDGGRPRLLPFAPHALQPAIAARGERLAYADWTRNVNLWRMDLQSSAQGATALLTGTSRDQRAPNISPDGQRMVFESDRSGSPEVWASNLDGSEAVQLCTFRSAGTPSWSPDGKWVVFDSPENGRSSLYLVDPLAGVPRRIDIGTLAAAVPRWSRDGTWIYFLGGLTGHQGIYKTVPQGGVPQMVRSGLGVNPQEDTTGRTLYFMAGWGHAEIHALNLEKRVERRLEGMPEVRTPTEWVVASRGIYFVDTVTKPASIDFYDFGAARVTRRMPLPKPPVFWGGLALSPAESWLAYAQIDRNESDLMLAEHFR